MRPKHIGQVDLNLLPALVAVLEERHVSRAAVRVGLSQPAMSRALQRLRRLLGDELLVRDPDGYRLTARGQRIQRQLEDFVPALDNLFVEEVFDPRDGARSFSLSGSDYAVGALGPALFQRVLTESPGSVLHFRHWHDGSVDAVAKGDVDLVFLGGAAPGKLRSEELFADRFVCVVAADHPLASQSAVTFSQYLQCQHLVVDVEDGLQPAIDKPLEALGTARRARLTVPYHSAATLALPGTELVLTLPARMVGSHVDERLCRVLAPPQEVRTLTYRMAWHPGMDHEPSHIWLRETVRSVAVTGSGSRPSGHARA